MCCCERWLAKQRDRIARGTISKARRAKRIDEMVVYDKDIKDLKKYIIFEAEELPSVVYVIAIHAVSSKNISHKISCQEGMPIAGYRSVYEDDEILVKCVEKLKLGSIPISYKAKIPGSGNWNINVPVPESVIRRYLSFEQRKALKAFKEQFANEEVVFEYVQMKSSFF